MAPDPMSRPPSKMLWAAEMPRAAWTVASWSWERVLRDAPRGDGRPIIVLPGLFNSDRSNFAMRLFLNRLGYQARPWNLGRNLGSRTIGAAGEHLFARIAERHAETGERVTLIGVSLGGIMARFAAHRHPELVREVITVSSPYAGDPRATNVWRAFEWLTGERIDDPVVVARRAEIAAPLPVPGTAIWSRSDGLVAGAICHSTDCRAIEVHSGHLGVQVKPEVLRVIAEVLGER
jgi:triacylglycerol lipase